MSTLAYGCQLTSRYDSTTYPLGPALEVRLFVTLLGQLLIKKAVHAVHLATGRFVARVEQFRIRVDNLIVEPSLGLETLQRRSLYWCTANRDFECTVTQTVVHLWWSVPPVQQSVTHQFLLLVQQMLWDPGTHLLLCAPGLLLRLLFELFNKLAAVAVTVSNQVTR